MRKLSVIVVLCLSSAAYAADDAPSNIFHADLSNPDLAAAVTAFEDVCMPFVLHKTELTRAWDKAHHENHLAGQNFIFQSGEVIPRKYLIEPAREEWKPPTQALNAGSLGAGGRVNTHTRGQFTVFDGTSYQSVKSTKTIVLATGVTIGRVPFVPAKYKTIPTDVQTYALASDARVTAVLDWNFPFQSLPPGKSCEMHLKTPDFDKSEFIESFIEKDADWIPSETFSSHRFWEQCVINGKEQFLFTANYSTGEDIVDSFSVKVTRNDRRHKSVCTLIP